MKKNKKHEELQKNCDETKGSKKQKSKRKRHLIPRLVGFGVKATTATGVVGILGTWGAWQYAKEQAKIRRDYTPSFNRLVTTERYQGKVQRVGDELSFVTASTTYSLIDPLAKLEQIYSTSSNSKDKNAKLIDEIHEADICILAKLSERGHYGYLGHLAYQLTLEDIC